MFKRPTLAHQAKKLIEVLNNIVWELDGCKCAVCIERRQFEADYARRFAHDLRPLINDFRKCVTNSKSREDAADLLTFIDAIMSQAGAANSKGELNIFTHGDVSNYYELRTIFQESEYRGQVL